MGILVANGNVNVREELGSGPTVFWSRMVTSMCVRNWVVDLQYLVANGNVNVREELVSGPTVVKFPSNWSMCVVFYVVGNVFSPARISG